MCWVGRGVRGGAEGKEEVKVRARGRDGQSERASESVSKKGRKERQWRPVPIVGSAILLQFAGQADGIPWFMYMGGFAILAVSSAASSAMFVAQMAFFNRVRCGRSPPPLARPASLIPPTVPAPPTSCSPLPPIASFNIPPVDAPVQ